VVRLRLASSASAIAALHSPVSMPCRNLSQPFLQTIRFSPVKISLLNNSETMIQSRTHFHWIAQCLETSVVLETRLLDSRHFDRLELSWPEG
jgi:hypothetical protein